MADLDDFFAKKERKKKSKGKGKKFITTDEIVKTIETSESQSSEKSVANTDKSALGTLTVEAKEDEEWKDFESEEKDLTGLKIQTLKIDDEKIDEIPQEQNLKEKPQKEDEADFPFPNVQKTGGNPWNKENIVTTPTETEAEVLTGGKSTYVPPHMRFSDAAGGSSSSQANKKKVVPDFNSIQAFPSLGQSVVSSEKMMPSVPMHDFQTVRGSGGGRHHESEAQSIEHRNKYEALETT